MKYVERFLNRFYKWSSKDLLYAILGILVSSLAINFFIVPNSLYNGGFLGLSQLIRTGIESAFDLHFTFDIAGEIKDALLGSVMMGNTRFIISNEDYQRYTSDSKIKDYKGCIYNIDTDDVKILINDIADVEGVLFADGKDVIKICYIMEMIVAMIVLILSVCLIIVSFVLLKFEIYSSF